MADNRNNTTENVQNFSCRETGQKKADMHTGVCQNVIQNVKHRGDVMKGNCNLKWSVVLESSFIYINVTLHLIWLYYSYTKTLLYKPPESSSGT